MTTVHQNACKDNIVECTKPKIVKVSNIIVKNKYKVNKNDFT